MASVTNFPTVVPRVAPVVVWSPIVPVVDGSPTDYSVVSFVYFVPASAFTSPCIGTTR